MPDESEKLTLKIELDAEVVPANRLTMRESWASGSVKRNGDTIKYNVTRGISGRTIIFEFEGKRDVIVDLGNLTYQIYEHFDEIPNREDH